MVGIYKVTNIINNKIYIGQSKNIEQRWKAHRNKPFNSNESQYNTAFYRAIRKYGLKNFIFEVLEECFIDELDEKEIYYIKLYNSSNPEFGYNLTEGGNIGFSIKLDKNTVNAIYDLLENSNLSEQKIADKFNISQRMVSAINLGQSHIKQNYIYPLRKKSIIQKKIAYCKDCGKELKIYTSQYCPDCAKKHLRVVERPSRDELKYLIRTKPFTKIGQQFGVSDKAITKWCISMDLPSKKKDIQSYSDEEWETV